MPSFKMDMDEDSYSGSKMSSVACGVPAKDAAGNTCSVASIAGGDNIDIFNGQLIIAEDSEGAHVHNYLWCEP